MQIHVKAKELKQVFEELGILFKVSEQFRAVCFTHSSNKLYITANTGCRYEACLEVEETAKEEMSSCVIFRDIAEVIPGSKSVVVDVEPLFVTVDIGYMEVTLNQANEIVTPMKHVRGTSTELDTISFISNLTVLSNTSFLKKAYKLNPPIILGKDYSLVKFPTVWILGRPGIIGSNFIQEDIDIITKFAPTSYIRNDSDVIFYNNLSMLMLGCTDPSENKFAELASPCKKVCTTTTEGIASSLRKLIKVIGTGDVNLHLCENGFRLTVHRVGLNSNIRFGEDGPILVTVKIPLEFLVGIFSMLNGEIKIGYGGGKLCLVTSQTHILISING